MFDDLKQGDRVISVLDDEDISRYTNLHKQLKEFEFYKSKMARAFNKFQAMQVMFWEDMMGKHEMCESAGHRGKVLTACKVDGKCVIVERPAPKESMDD